MKIISTLILVILLFACANNTEQEDSSKDEQIDEQIENDPTTIIIYQSDDMGVSEFLKHTKTEGEPSVWAYYTSKNPKEIELGVMNHRGMEMIFFKNNPDVIYDILGSECGFTLEENDTISQWYEQINPACDLN